MQKIILKNIENIDKGAEMFIEAVSKNKKFAFYGKMGAGKTTFIKAVCHKLGAVDVVNSPSFALINEYHSDSGGIIYHIDLYRIKNIEELYDIGYEDYFYGNEYLFIEWPELAENILPEDIVRVRIEEIQNGERQISIL